MKKTLILKIIIVSFILFSIFCVMNSALAYDWGSQINTMDGQKGDSTLNGKVTSIVGAIISIFRIVGTGVAIIMLTTVAMKYMSAAPGDRADIKKHAVPFVVGAIVLFGSTGILGIIADFSKNINTSGGAS